MRLNEISSKKYANDKQMCLRIHKTISICHILERAIQISLPRPLVTLKSFYWLHANRVVDHHYENKREYSIPVLISQPVVVCRSFSMEIANEMSGCLFKRFEM